MIWHYFFIILINGIRALSRLSEASFPVWILQVSFRHFWAVKCEMHNVWNVQAEMIVLHLYLLVLRRLAVVQVAQHLSD